MTESMFGRLFRFARSADTKPIENFTTEALAACIRADPRPFVGALTSHGVPVHSPKGASHIVATQEVVPGVGVVDLLDRLVVGTAIDAELWVEVKVWAPESGDQLARYQAHINELHDDIRRTLLTVGPRPIVSATPWVSWQAIRDSVLRAERPGHLWLELSDFLEETNVADASTDPISAREASSLLDAHRLFKKAARVLTEVRDIGVERFPDWGWVGREQLSQHVLGQFQRHSRFTVPTTERPFYLILGYSDLHATGEAHLTVWVESDPRKPDLRTALLQAAEVGSLPATWVRRLDTWQALSITRRAATVEGVEAAVDWFVERLEELATADIRPSPVSVSAES
jgi:hypothetical protein